MAASRGKGRSTPDSAAGAPLPPIDLATREVEPVALSLIWRVLRLVDAAKPLIIQFVSCAGDDSGRAVALAFAKAAATAIGRTVLINNREAAATTPLPDAFIPHLYHQSMPAPELCGVLWQTTDRSGGAGTAFDAVVIDQTPQSGYDGVCAAAPMCSGTVLVVRAGLTDLESIRGVIINVAAVGGKIVGSVLVGTPAWSGTR